MRSVQLEIQDVAFGGKGVARDEGKAVFVPFTIDGETVRARLVREKKNFAEAALLEVLAPSPERVEPGCPYFGRCGGCSYQHIAYAHQLALKSRQVEQTLRRVGHLASVPLRPMIASPQPYEYRNRITVHAVDGVVGFYADDEHRLLDIERCPISGPAVNEELARLRARPVRDGHYTLRANRGTRSFSQTNDAVGAALRELVAELVPADRALVIDAYCGSGFFAKRLVGHAEHILGLDWDQFAIQLARDTATETETYLAGDVGVHLREALENAELARTAVVLDPPAEGLAPTVRHALLDFPARDLVYVSCHPATLARDLAELAASYAVDSVTPLDMFPQTAEIEVAVHLRRRDA